MLDLSHAAARELGMVEAGTTAVQIEVIGDHRASRLSRWEDFRCRGYAPEQRLPFGDTAQSDDEGFEVPARSCQNDASRSIVCAA